MAAGIQILQAAPGLDSFAIMPAVNGTNLGWARDVPFGSVSGNPHFRNVMVNRVLKNSFNWLLVVFASPGFPSGTTMSITVNGTNYALSRVDDLNWSSVGSGGALSEGLWHMCRLL